MNDDLGEGRQGLAEKIGAFIGYTLAVVGGIVLIVLLFKALLWAVGL